MQTSAFECGDVWRNAKCVGRRVVGGIDWSDDDCSVDLRAGLLVGTKVGRSKVNETVFFSFVGRRSRGNKSVNDGFGSSRGFDFGQVDALLEGIVPQRHFARLGDVTKLAERVGGDRQTSVSDQFFFCSRIEKRNSRVNQTKRDAQREVVDSERHGGEVGEGVEHDSTSFPRDFWTSEMQKSSATSSAERVQDIPVVVDDSAIASNVPDARASDNAQTFGVDCVRFNQNAFQKALEFVSERSPAMKKKRKKF